MRFSLCCAGAVTLLCLAVPRVRAEEAAPTTPAPIQPLTIPVPSNARVRVEIDAGRDDLLGMVKSFLKGLDGRVLTGMMGMAAPGGGFGAPGAVMTSAGGASASSMEANAAASWTRTLEQVDLGKMLKDINHIHLVVYETVPAGGAGTGRPAPLDLSKLYEEPFRAEGGRRLVWSDFDDVQMLTVGFEQPRGFAAVFQAPGMVGIARADGYPDLEGLGPVMGMLVFMGTRLQGSFSTQPMEASPPVATPSSTPPIEVAPPPVKPAVVRPPHRKPVPRQPAASGRRRKKQGQ